MARNKRGKEMAAGYKTKEDIQLAKTTGVYEVEISENIHESSSTEENPAAHKARKERKARLALRRASRNKKKENASSSTPIEKRYDVLALYHQLNYDAVQAAIKELNMKPSVIDNNRLWLINLSKDEYDAARTALIKCHFETKQHKQYKVRVAGYKHVEHADPPKRKKKPTNNKPEVALAAKKKRKADNIRKATNRGRHLLGRKAKKHDHKPGSTDTSTYKKKALINAKKALKLLERKEKDRSIQAKSRASKPIPKQRGKAKQGKLKFAA